MQIYFHSRLWSYLPRVPILVEGTVYQRMRHKKSDRPLDIELYNAVFFFVLFLQTCLHMITMVKTINYIKSHLCKISVSI